MQYLQRFAPRAPRLAANSATISNARVRLYSLRSAFPVFLLSPTYNTCVLTFMSIPIVVIVLYGSIVPRGGEHLVFAAGSALSGIA